MNHIKKLVFIRHPVLQQSAWGLPDGFFFTNLHD
jgi:hypothetical protein